MPDPITDLATLAAQVKAIGGDVGRCFEQLSALAVSLEQLRDRLDALSTRATPIPFGAALGGSWVQGTMSPETSISPDSVGTTPGAIAVGEMLVALPNGARIQSFRAFIRVADVELLPAPADPANARLRNVDICELIISLRRLELNVKQSLVAEPQEPVVQLSHPFAPGHPQLQGVPISGREIVDNDAFLYFFSAEFRVRPGAVTSPGFVVPEQMVVLNSFEVRCVFA